ncbi:HYR domain-containing protein, partial [Gaoshiqia sediminis]
DNGSTDNCGIQSLALDIEAFTCAHVGQNNVVLTVTDVNGNSSTANAVVTVVDDIDPVLSCPTSITLPADAGMCGAIVAFAATVSDNCSAEITYSQNPGSFFPVGTTSVTVTATDPSGNSDVCSFDVEVTNSAPHSVVITGPDSPNAVGTNVILSATFIDENIATAVWKAFDGTTDVDEVMYNISGNSTNHTFVNLPVGVHTIILELEDYCGARTTEVFQYVVVYDPDGGFVTGGGWINSPEGAYAADATLTGKANFGFNAKYKKGSNAVDGNTEFQFHAGNMNFKSSSHDAMSLVIAGAKAIYKGQGSINKVSGYSFMVSAIDGDLKAKGEPDRFRIKIWESATGSVVYDNQLGADDNAEAITALGGGSVVIHNPKKKTAEIASVDADDQLVTAVELKAYPNPFTDRLLFEFVAPETVQARIDVYDLNGRLVKTVLDELVESGVAYQAEFVPDVQSSNIYFYRMVLGSEVFNGKVICNK